jgi:hypothetical protein
MRKTFFIFNTKVFILVFVVYAFYYPFKVFVLKENIISEGAGSVTELLTMMIVGTLFNAFLYSAIATFIYWLIKKVSPK